MVIFFTLASGFTLSNSSMTSCAFFLSGVSINFEMIGISVTDMSFCRELTLEVACGSSVLRVIGNGTVDEAVTALVMVVLPSVITFVELIGTTVCILEKRGFLLPVGFGWRGVEAGPPEEELSSAPLVVEVVPVLEPMTVSALGLGI